MDWNVVPIERWPGELTDEEERKRHPFRTPRQYSWGMGTEHGVNWAATCDLLLRELLQLDAENVLLQMAVTDADIRIDGWIRANARPTHPGVILTFDSKHGPLSYPCDTFDDWQANVRGIALALEALRKIDRYGVTKTGEQYRGWKQLPGAGQTGVTMTARKAAEIMVRLEARGGDPDDLLERGAGELAVAYTYRNAAKRAHPDAGGSVEDFQLLQTAKAVLNAHHNNQAR